MKKIIVIVLILLPTLTFSQPVLHQCPVPEKVGCWSEEIARVTANCLSPLGVSKNLNCPRMEAFGIKQQETTLSICNMEYQNYRKLDTQYQACLQQNKIIQDAYDLTQKQIAEQEAKAKEEQAKLVVPEPTPVVPTPVIVPPVVTTPTPVEKVKTVTKKVYVPVKEVVKSTPVATTTATVTPVVEIVTPKPWYRKILDWFGL